MIAILVTLLLAAGGTAAAWVSAKFVGLRRLAFLFVLLVSPFVILALALGSGIDPTLTAAQASYNYWLGFGLITTVMLVPWGLAVLVGALVGASRSKRRAGASPVAAPPAQLPRQWAPGDVTLLNAEALNREIAALAHAGGVDLQRVPHVGPPTDNGSAHVEIDLNENAYHLIVTERGQQTSRRRTDILERLLYWIADEMTYILATHAPRSEDEKLMEYSAMLRSRQSALMLKVAPQWHGGWLVDPEAMGRRLIDGAQA